MRPDSSPASKEFRGILKLVRAAVEARISLIQLREKKLPAKTLYELALRSAEITRGTDTRLLVNDRADIARAARADGVHLATRSIEASVIRRTFGARFLIGVSTHSLAEAQKARDDGADFAVFGPIFDTASKRIYGPPVGIERLGEAAGTLSPFPIIALGGITLENAAYALGAGASGIAAIRLLFDAQNLKRTAEAVRRARMKAQVKGKGKR